MAFWAGDSSPQRHHLPLPRHGPIHSTKQGKVVSNHFAVRGGPVSSNILGHFLYLGLAATSRLSLQ